MCIIGLFVVVLAQSAASVANAAQTICAMGVNRNAFKQLAPRLMLRRQGNRWAEINPGELTYLPRVCIAGVLPPQRVAQRTGRCSVRSLICTAVSRTA